MSDIKKLEDITRNEWIVWYWFFAGGFENPNQYIRGIYRDPSEAERAGAEWDEWHKAYEAVNNG